MSTQPYRFSRPENLELVSKPKLTVAVVIACRGGQEKLDLVLASLAAQSYPSRLVNVYIVDDGSDVAITLPKIRPSKTKIISYKNSRGRWGKTAATNDCVSKLKEDVLWFIDADMVLDPDHLAHHMKWHHDADDYAVLGWKRFVESWDYTPSQLHARLLADEFLELHETSWGKELWEARVDRTKDLVEPGLDGYRAFVGATFSMKRNQWKRLGGYNRELITGEDTELGWRVYTSGMRIVPDRQAHSWHLGHSTVEKNKEEIHRHNDPALAQFIPQMHTIRNRFEFDWKVPTYEIHVDVRNCSLAQVLHLRSLLLILKGTSAHFTLLGPWSALQDRYSPVTDERANAREIYNWLKGDPQYSFIDVDDSVELTIDAIIANFSPTATPYYLFVEGDFEIDLKDLVDYLLKTGNGMVGVANNSDRRAFAIIAPALARATYSGGWIYKDISQQFGVKWITEGNFAQINHGKHNFFPRVLRFLKREVKKINSPRQLLIFIKRVISIVSRKVLRRG